ncbi:hypothetical protein [Psychrobacter urativorans]|uniref:hypothetical protein n=1 Tax=Psychrobacter urativorans TaxID=45610 RepID=UPI000ABA8ADF|nr:hypothetical protein [Psychrobacter urativorans]
MSCLSVTASHKLAFVHHLCSAPSRYLQAQPSLKKIPTTALFVVLATTSVQVYADSMSTLITQKSAQPELAVPAARVSTRSTIQRVRMNAPTTTATNNINAASSNKATVYKPQAYKQQAYKQQVIPTPVINTAARYPEVKRQAPSVLPAFLSGGSITGSYDNVDSAHLPLLSRAEKQSSRAAREVISMARTMSLNERTVIKGGCWDYLNAVFNRAGVNRSTVHKGAYAEGPYVNSGEIQVGDWLYYINHGYNDIEHSGLFVGWVDQSAKQALILSYAGESRKEPARYRVYDLSHVYQIIRPT